MLPVLFSSFSEGSEVEFGGLSKGRLVAVGSLAAIFYLRNLADAPIEAPAPTLSVVTS
jgi:hypothetical protein